MLTDQVIKRVDALRTLYGTAYEDPESFESIGSEISATIHEIASNVEPSVDDGDLDGMIQEIIKAVDKKVAAREKELDDKRAAGRKSRKRRG